MKLYRAVSIAEMNDIWMSAGSNLLAMLFALWIGRLSHTDYPERAVAEVRKEMEQLDARKSESRIKRMNGFC